MLWPWQQFRGVEDANSNDKNIFQQTIILPSDYTEVTGNPVMIMECAFAFFLSIFLVVYLKNFIQINK